MKKTFQILFTVLFFVIGQKAIAQEYIKNFDGIPILSISPGDISQNHYGKMREMGVNVVLAQNIDDTVLDWIYRDSMKAIPWQNDTTLMNYIIKYTDGRYTKWEAEGQPEADGLARLSYDDSIGMPVTIAGVPGIITKDMAPADTLINGPGYRQEVRYSSIYPERKIDYFADFQLRLSYSREESGSPSDEICILQVTNSRIVNGVIDSVQVIKDTILYRSDFIMGAWDTTQLSYDLTALKFGEEITYNRIGIGTQQSTRTYANYVEFKVIWLGNENYRLFVDNITVYDERGLRIVTKDLDKGLVANQANNSFNTTLRNNTVVAWFALDEPECIDNYEPIRVVDSILNHPLNGGNGLWVSLPSSWNGKFGDNDLGTQKLYKFEEFYRRTKIKSFQNNHPLYHYPWANADSCGGCDYRLENIDYLINSALDKLNDYDSIYFSMTLLCGRVNAARLFHEPLPHEMLYEANLKMLYGAKSLSLYRYFGTEDTTTFSGLVNPLTSGGYVYTPRYYFVKDVLSPRLIGLMGKTLKTAVLDTQFAGSNAVDATDLQGGYFGTNGYDKLEEINSIGNIESPICEIELGFFHNKSDAEKKYFMALNRYYSNKTKLVFSLKNLNEYNNWELRDYVEDSRITLNAAYTGTAHFNDTITAGDSRLYSVLPVVKYGGKLIADESVGEGMTLIDAMSIEAGATLSVYGEYNANADITIKPGGKIVSGDNGRIIFSNGHQLIIEGIAQIKGSASNRLEIVFTGSDSGGVKIKPNGTLKAFYCNISGVNGAINGITSESPTKSVTIENVNISGFGECGISSEGSFGEGTPDVTPTIKNCSITNCGTGISIANFYEFVISGNTITNCKLGIYVAHIPAVFVVGNNITYSSNPELWGIFMLSSNGNIRGNTVTGHTNGIHLVYSSPNIGGNILEHNSEHGLFVDIGSVPNLVRGLTGPLPLVIAVSGYNVIKENGIEGFGPMNGDGSEIFLRESYIFMNEGCNQIIDDQGEPENFLLMNGSTSDGSEIKAEYNYWGTTEPNNHRFGDLVVYFDPFNPSPYYTGPCTTPQSTCEEVAERTSRGELVDMIAVKNCEVQQLTDLEQNYAEAEMHYLSGDMDESRIAYQQIVAGQNTPEEKLIAYNKLYAIGNLIDTTNNYFTELQNIFSNLSQSISDSVLKAVFRQNEILCKVSKEEYTAAINDFDNIIQQNPQSEEAVFAEMDILTTALLVDTVGGQLGKMAGGKYMVKGSSD